MAEIAVRPMPRCPTFSPRSKTGAEHPAAIPRRAMPGTGRSGIPSETKLDNPAAADADSRSAPDVESLVSWPPPQLAGQSGVNARDLDGRARTASHVCARPDDDLAGGERNVCVDHARRGVTAMLAVVAAGVAVIPWCPRTTWCCGSPSWKSTAGFVEQAVENRGRYATVLLQSNMTGIPSVPDVMGRYQRWRTPATAPVALLSPKSCGLVLAQQFAMNRRSSSQFSGHRLRRHADDAGRRLAVQGRS